MSSTTLLIGGVDCNDRVGTRLVSMSLGKPARTAPEYGGPDIDIATIGRLDTSALVESRFVIEVSASSVDGVTTVVNNISTAVRELADITLRLRDSYSTGTLKPRIGECIEIPLEDPSALLERHAVQVEVIVRRDPWVYGDSENLYEDACFELPAVIDLSHTKGSAQVPIRPLVTAPLADIRGLWMGLYPSADVSIKDFVHELHGKPWVTGGEGWDVIGWPNGTGPGTNALQSHHWWDSVADNSNAEAFNLDYTGWSGWSGVGTVNNPYALTLDGVNDGLTFGDLGVAEDKTFTYEVWFRTTIVGTTYLLVEENIGGGEVPAVMLCVDGGILKGLSISGAWAATTVAGTVPVNDGNWHHAILTCDATHLRLYQDGAQVGGDVDVPAYAYTFDATSAGGFAGTKGAVSLAVLRLYSVPLSLSQIAGNFAAGYVNPHHSHIERVGLVHEYHAATAARGSLSNKVTWWDNLSAPIFASVDTSFYEPGEYFVLVRGSYTTVAGTVYAGIFPVAAEMVSAPLDKTTLTWIPMGTVRLPTRIGRVTEPAPYYVGMKSEIGGVVNINAVAFVPVSWGFLGWHDPASPCYSLAFEKGGPFADNLTSLEKSIGGRELRSLRGSLVVVGDPSVATAPTLHTHWTL